MTKIYTKTGDKGMTTLYGGSKVRKSSSRVGAYGTVDEANSFIGLAASHIGNEDLEALLRLCQRKLFIIGAQLASDDRGRRALTEVIVPNDAAQLERLIDVFAAKLPASREFLIPGKSARSAYLHVARAMVRKAERQIVGIREEARVSQDVCIYMNRLSDFLFILSRVVDELNIFAETKGEEESIL
ncbi:cob(I)yrinic acid a,c-diamide adenosyltransferase [Bacilliculturomica massiliensis]|uniref:cob(I)yrinic acid a,c-diamide adenosyltransferase n=1 Tax=Bacilliculturomica massiliensis TaxID=1917867 RepID=UPI00103213EE|nr:cob(I)yrinic acid a,c-diamide adenosyltransferase [Bacilliculturomica massiliensis]